MNEKKPAHAAPVVQHRVANHLLRPKEIALNVHHRKDCLTDLSVALTHPSRSLLPDTNLSAFLWARRLNSALSARLRESLAKQDSKLVHR
ncbi:hypothetical protein [Burkholderia vietnamiensis]|uniref:hypothetical protein n=1 Tax=Burkholderia vietnamiensis TaxID=60552 RepID=UPI0011B25E59|nr:hypothetical protein [Burkholderia vietnamiensis]